MRITVFGATGRTGKRVVHAAIERGHTVVAVARSAAKHTWPPGVEVLPGSVLDADLVRQALTGADALIVAISMVRSSDSPWAKILTPKDLHIRAVETLSTVAKEVGVTRYVAISAHGVGDSEKRAGTMFMALVNRSNIGVAYKDLARAEDKLATTDLNWTVVRPTRLTNEQRTENWTAGTDLVCGSRANISREDVALFLVLCAEDGRHSKERVSLTTIA
jgi:putative NADH-flavin reductase